METSAAEFDRWYADQVESPVADERLPPRLRQLDLVRQLPLAGFADVDVAEKPAWRAVELELWQEALTIDAGDDLAMQSIQDEGRRVLATFDGLCRVLATATAPG